jgi:hypothetical protein
LASIAPLSLIPDTDFDTNLLMAARSAIQKEERVKHEPRIAALISIGLFNGLVYTTQTALCEPTNSCDFGS